MPPAHLPQQDRVTGPEEIKPAAPTEQGEEVSCGRPSTLVAPPASEPVTLAEAKAWLRIDAADDDATPRPPSSPPPAPPAEAAPPPQPHHPDLEADPRPGVRRPDAYVGRGVRDLPDQRAATPALPRTLPLPKRAGAVGHLGVTTYDPDRHRRRCTTAANYRLDPSGDRVLLLASAPPGPPTGAARTAGCEIVYVRRLRGLHRRAAARQDRHPHPHSPACTSSAGMCDDAMKPAPGQPPSSTARTG